MSSIWKQYGDESIANLSDLGLQDCSLARGSYAFMLQIIKLPDGTEYNIAGAKRTNASGIIHIRFEYKGKKYCIIDKVGS